MHRSTFAAIALCSMAGAASPARASVITQTLTPLVQTQGPYPGDQIVADPFLPSAGTLTGVTLELDGALLPKGDGLPGPQTAVTLKTAVSVIPDKPGQDSFMRSFPAVPATLGGIVGEGPARLETGETLTIDTTFNFTDLTPFVDGLNGPEPLIYYGFGTVSSAGALVLDRTYFNGDAILTYTYSTGATAPAGVPEPASAALLGFGATAFALMRRRSGRGPAR